ncbi:hypothetical protein [Treponema sp.]|uniref:hypothetical protein n=1 Tax=Treponema sp. TaxID=166 RepID=UPI003FD7088B
MDTKIVEPQDVELLNQEQAAKFLHCSVSYIDNCAKDFPRVRYGRKVLFNKSTLTKWILSKEDNLGSIANS